MQALIDSITTKLLDSAVSNDVGGRCYYDTADSDDLPRLVYSIVSGFPDRTFSELYHDVLIQFDLCEEEAWARLENLTAEEAVAVKQAIEISTITGYTL